MRMWSRIELSVVKVSLNFLPHWPITAQLSTICTTKGSTYCGFRRRFWTDFMCMDATGSTISFTDDAKTTSESWRLYLFCIIKQNIYSLFSSTTSASVSVVKALFTYPFPSGVRLGLIDVIFSQSPSSLWLLCLQKLHCIELSSRHN